MHPYADPGQSGRQGFDAYDENTSTRDTLFLSGIGKQNMRVIDVRTRDSFSNCVCKHTIAARSSGAVR